MFDFEFLIKVRCGNSVQCSTGESQLGKSWEALTIGSLVLAVGQRTPAIDLLYNLVHISMNVAGRKELLTRSKISSDSWTLDDAFRRLWQQTSTGRCMLRRS